MGKMRDMDMQIRKESITRLVAQMLENINNGENPVVEISFCINCLESIADKDFTVEETAEIIKKLVEIIMG